MVKWLRGNDLYTSDVEYLVYCAVVNAEIVNIRTFTMAFLET